jgi:hypothetical protein
MVLGDFAQPKKNGKLFSRDTMVENGSRQHIWLMTHPSCYLLLTPGAVFHI